MEVANNGIKQSKSPRGAEAPASFNATRARQGRDPGSGSACGEKPRLHEWWMSGMEWIWYFFVPLKLYDMIKIIVVCMIMYVYILIHTEYVYVYIHIFYSIYITYTLLYSIGYLKN